MDTYRNHGDSGGERERESVDERERERVIDDRREGDSVSICTREKSEEHFCHLVIYIYTYK